MNIVAKPTTGSKQPVPAGRQRPMGGPAPANPDTFPGQHAQLLKKSPTLRGSPLGRYAVRPPLTPSLNLNSAIVRTTTWGSGCAPLYEYGRRPRSPDRRWVLGGRRESISIPRSLE